MSNDNDKDKARLFNLMAKILMMVVDGTRDATSVADMLLSILNQPQQKPVTQAVKTIFSAPIGKTFPITFGVSPRNVLKSAERTETTDQLYVDPDISKVLTLVGAEVVPTQVAVIERKLGDTTLLERDIKNALPKVSELSPVELVYLIATELQKVVDRKPSSLFNKKEWKLFFIGGLVVFVGWDDGSREWRVFVWKQNDGHIWHAGNTVVSLN